MKQVAAVDATTVWGLDSAGAHFKLSGGSWAKQGCCVGHISVGADGQLWATHPLNNSAILRWSGSAWTQVPGALASIAVASVWGVTTQGGIVRWSTNY